MPPGSTTPTLTPTTSATSMLSTPRGHDAERPVPAGKPVVSRSGGERSYVTVSAQTALLWAGLVRMALLHHADPTSARHGVDGGRLDPSAAVIRLLERLGRVYDVRRAGTGPRRRPPYVIPARPFTHHHRS